MGDVSIHEEEAVDHTPIKYLSINSVYSSTAPNSNPNGGSKKLKGRRLQVEPKTEEMLGEEGDGGEPSLVYSWRTLNQEIAGGDEDEDEDEDEEITPAKRKGDDSEPIALVGDSDGYSRRRPNQEIAGGYGDDGEDKDEDKDKDEGEEGDGGEPSLIYSWRTPNQEIAGGDDDKDEGEGEDEGEPSLVYSWRTMDQEIAGGDGDSDSDDEEDEEEDEEITPAKRKRDDSEPIALGDSDGYQTRLKSCPGRRKFFGSAEAGTSRRRRRHLPEDSAGRDEPIALGDSDGYQTRLKSCPGRRKFFGSAEAGTSRRRRHLPEDSAGLRNIKKWAELDLKGADPNAFIGLKCKVFWPMDYDWYKGCVAGYSSTTKQHHVEYADGDIEKLILRDEKIKFHISCADVQRLNLKFDQEKKGLNYNEMLALAATFDDSEELEPGEIVWAKVTGHAMWPAVIVDESNIEAKGDLQLIEQDQSVIVQFFGTHDFARIKLKQAIPFLNGLISSFHLKCKKPSFYQSLDEAKGYLSIQQLPKKMLKQRKRKGADDNWGSSGADEEKDDPCKEITEEMAQKAVEISNTSPLEIGKLRVTSLGKIVCNSRHFHDKKHIWTEGYTAYRKFTSVKDPGLETSYKMEVMRNHRAKARPLFRVTSDDGEKIEGPNPTSCWKEIYDRIRKKRSDGFHALAEGHDSQKSGLYMFGFSIPKVSKLIQALPNAKICSKYLENGRDVPEGYRTIRIEWKDLDRCSVCYMEEEYENDLFLQCDKCRMMVHGKCYGEVEPLDGILWLCNMCRPGAPSSPPICCLCPVTGGAIKCTTDGRWAHLACAIWIPETCLLDVKKMEPIDGLNNIHKARWKLLCSICGVAYGACIQCSNNACRVAYHPLCARAAGLCIELVDEDKTHLTSDDDDEDDQCNIRLLSYCKKHGQPHNNCQPANESITLPTHSSSSYVPPTNPSGCARTEPYNYFGRRGQKEPQVLASASVKRLFVENTPYLVGGIRRNGIPFGSDCNGSVQINSVSDALRLGTHHGTSACVSSMAEKYKNMKATFRKRLAFGKSRIHGFGVFAKEPHKAGDMVIEYIGEVVRPAIADLRERRIYNSLVGAGTYMFRIDNERVIDATRAGSIAHLINHSCEPNCYSRVLTVSGDDHIIIFAKRDINPSEELTYDYRFSSKDEKLACFCGFPRCRHVVNDVEAEEQTTKILVPRSELIPWTGE